MEKSKSVILKNFGGYDKISIEEFPLPPLEGHVEVKVEYAGVNFADIYTRQGLIPNRKFPFVLGLECVGTITALGISDTNLKVGERVICYNYLGGMYREVTRVKSEECYPLPDDVSSDVAAAVFVNYLTAYVAVLKMGALQSGESVFIQSCAGGVGWAATQLAKTVDNVTIYGTASKGKESFAKDNGVDFVFNYDDNIESSGGFDVIVANESGKALEKLQKLLKPLGRLVVLGASNIVQGEDKLSMVTLIKFWWQTKSIKLLDLIMHNRVISGVHLGTFIEKDPSKVRTYLAKIFDLLREGKIKPRIDSVWTLDEIVEATKVLAERRNVGKVLLAVSASK